MYSSTFQEDSNVILDFVCLFRKTTDLEVHSSASA